MHVRESLQAHLSGMRPSEAEVVRRLLTKLAVVAEKSLREVAAWCETSDATVMRACRTAGFDGFQDLKYHVLREFTAGGLKEPRTSNAYDMDLAASLAAAERAIEPAARLIGRARRVAMVACDILFTLQKQALLVQSEQMANYAFTPPVTGLVALCISHSGETRFTVQTAQEARQAGVKTIGLSNAPGSELARAVDVFVPTQAVEPARGSYAIAPRLCQLAVLDLLFSRACGSATSSFAADSNPVSASISP